MAKKVNSQTHKLVLVALLTALVAVLAYFGGFIKIGGFASISLTLVPIVLGAALCGPWAGAWLGLATGATILLSGDAAAFLTFDPAATILLVLLKGALSGLVAGLIYKLIAKRNSFAAITAAAFLCPIVNTGTFFIGCLIFFFPLVTEWAGGSGAISFVLTGLIGWNFVVELATSLVLTPATSKIIDIGKKMRHDKSYL